MVKKEKERSGSYFIGWQNITGLPLWPDVDTASLDVNTAGGKLLPPGVFLICGDRT